MSRYRNEGDGFDSLESFEDIGISVMEELDPEPQPKSGSLYAREFVIGMLLVLGVLAFAGMQWWQTEYRQSNYRLGEQAARQFDWDEASARFSAAEGYRDATKRAETAANRARERDEHYSLALEHFNNQRWASALKELRAVREVQPGYRDATSMEERAEGEVYSEALLGSVVMKPKADPPGLYYRSEFGWLWLEDSDEQSMPWGQGTPEHILYDAPIEGWVPPAQQSRRPNPSDLDEYRRSMAGRKLMVATFDTGGNVLGVTYRELPFNLSDYDWFEWNRDGVWGILLWDVRAGNEEGHVVIDPSPVRQKIRNIQQITYHAFGSKIMRSTNPTFYGMNVALMDYNRNGDELLVANWTRHDDGTFTVALYLNSLTKGENKLLYNHEGGFVNASFSDEGRYVFLTTYNSVGRMLEDHMLIMIDKTGAEPARVVMQQNGVRAINGVLVDSQQYMQARLLEGGPFAGKMLLTQWISFTNYISVVDLDGPHAVHAEASITGNGMIWWDVVSTEGPDLVLWGIGSVNTVSPPFPAQQTLVGVKISPGKPPVVARQAIARTSSVVWLEQRGSELIYLVHNHNRRAQLRAVELYAVALSDLESGNIPAKLLHRYEYRVPIDQHRLPFGGFSFHFGPGMFAYLDQTTLRAVTYDGQVSLPLESDVAELFNLDLASP
ncbi:MAG: hypothetical protein M3437_03060 [Chloroflexota bacterium]|nr:hypothetical protein [Chloroflexota bacterium]MDQ5864673.1 hypothetical protein [Chloroflexota bacterium]